MDGFSIALGILAALVGAYGLFFAATGRTAGHPVTRFLFAPRGAGRSRAHAALVPAALVVWGAYCILSGADPRLPLWPSVVLLLVACALLMAAHLQREGV